jgi:hypothetical protein
MASSSGASSLSSILYDKISNRCSVEGEICKLLPTTLDSTQSFLLQTLNRGQIRPEETQYLVKNLVGGRTYYFRVLANSLKSYESSDEVKFPVPARVKVSSEASHLHQMLQLVDLTAQSNNCRRRWRNPLLHCRNYPINMRC